MNPATLAIRSTAAAALILLATAPALAQSTAPETTPPDTTTATDTATPDTVATTPDTTMPDDTTAVDRTAAETVPDRAVDRPERDRDIPWGLLGLLGLAGLMKRKDETRVVHNPNTARPGDTHR